MQRNPFTGMAVPGASPEQEATGGEDELDVDRAWEMLTAMARGASAGRPQTFHPPARISEAAAQLLDLMLPLCLGDRASRLVVAHLGQTLDGRVATPTGASQFITGQEDLCHTHRLRALCDVVLVGAQTVFHDDPRLTTRLVKGRSPVRAVLDPRARLSSTHKVFCDGAVETLWIVGRDDRQVQRPAAHVQVLRIRSEGGLLDLKELLSCLRQRGLARVFVEGGGVTVSRFIAEKLLDRLHLAVAPRIIGSGVPALSLPPVDQLCEILPVESRRFDLGQDTLFDCNLRPE